MIRLLLRQPGAGSSVVCFSKDVKVPVKVRRTLSSVGTSSSNSPVLNPDSSIRMNCCDSPWLFALVGLCFAEDTFFYHQYFISNLVIIVNTFSVLVLIATISQRLPILCQSATNGMSKSMSCWRMVAPGEALSM
jgi:hypothetical protein